MLRPVVISVFLALVSAWPVAAQDYAFQGFAADMAMNALNASVRDASMGEDQSRSAPVAKPQAVTTRYLASAAVSRQAQQQFIDFIRSTSGGPAAAALENEFADTGPSQRWAALVAGDGLVAGDAVDAIAGYWMLNWIIANQVPAAQFDTGPILRQVRAALSSDASFRALSEAQRQELSEILMMNFLVQQSVFSEAVSGGNQQLMSQLAQAAVARFRNEAGIDLRQIEVTSAGFVEK